MKHSAKLIVLFIISASNAVFHLISSYFKYDTLEEDVANKLSNHMADLPKIDLDSIPDFVLEDVLVGFSHYTEYGVAYYYTEFWSYAIGLAGILMMASFKKSGFWVYIIGQILGFAAIFVGYGLNLTFGLGALLYALLAWLFIRLYKKWFVDRLTAH